MAQPLLRSLTLTGATLGVSLFSPLVAAPEAAASTTTPDDDSGCTRESDARTLDSALDDTGPGETVCVPQSHKHGQHARPRRLRPMSSGEEQYRNGCRRGYIVNGCDFFDTRNLLRLGISPYR